MSDLAIHVQNVSKHYQLGLIGSGDLRTTISRTVKRWTSLQPPNKEIFVALDNINLEVKTGEVIGIIGRNGAGKSTLLKVLSKITQPTSGRITLNGRVASLLEVGTGFHPELTGRENIFLNGSILGMGKTEITSKFDEIVDFSGVEKFLETPVKRYSSGMYVRLAFAVAAHLEPEILVIDEVLAVGDAEFQKKCLGRMNTVAQEGRTVLFVSHNMMAVRQLCSRSVMLHHGKTYYEGDTDDTINKYLSINQSNSRLTLEEREDRKGNGNLRLTDWSLMDSRQNKVERIMTGTKTNLVLTFDVKKDISNAIFRVQFFSLTGHLLFICNNHHSGDLLNFSKGNHQHVVCCIDKLPLNPGQYRIDFNCSSMGETLDEIEFAGEIEVESGDFFGTGNLPTIKHGVLVENNWSYGILTPSN